MDNIIQFEEHWRKYKLDIWLEKINGYIQMYEYGEISFNILINNFIEMGYDREELEEYLEEYA
tara:strand:+ start:157 stop:345 length:189 start_codon:yes stop_codon:yes gene_type:complete